MKFFIKVKIRTKKEKVEQIDKNNLIISVKELPIDGKANQAVVELLAKFLKVPKSSIEIIKGFRSRNKTIEIKGFVP